MSLALDTCAKAPYMSEVRVLVKGRSGEEIKAVTQLKTPYNQNLTENMLNRRQLIDLVIFSHI